MCAKMVKFRGNATEKKTSIFCFSIQFSSVQDGIYALGKAHKYALHSVSQEFPQCRLFIPVTENLHTHKSCRNFFKLRFKEDWIGKTWD